MRTLLGMQYGGNVPQQYPRQQIPPQQFQEGGGVSSGLAYLLRGKKRKKAYDEAKRREQTLGERMGWSRTFGTALGVGGGLLAAALAPATGGLSLLAPALGTAAGKYFGSKLGYGKDEEYDDMMYGEEAGLGDIEAAGESYEGQMGQGALTSGLIAGLTAGFAPDGGIYGKVAGKLSPTDVAGATSSLGGVGTVADLGTQVTPETEIANRAMRSQAFQPQSGSMAVPDLKHLTQNIPSAPGSLLGTGAGELAPEITTEAADILGAYTGTAAQNRQLLDAGGYGGTSIVDALKRAGLGSSFQERAGMYENIYGSPQIAGLMGGGTVQQTPRTLLSLIG